MKIALYFLAGAIGQSVALASRFAELSTHFAQDASPEMQSLYKAGINGDIRAVQQYLNQGLSPDAVYSGETMPLLYHAADTNHVVLLDTLLAAGASPNAPRNISDPNSPSALQIATYRNHIHAAKALVEHGGDTATWTNSVPDPIIIATTHGYFGIVEHLLANGVSPDTSLIDKMSKDKYQSKTLLQIALENNNTPMVEKLLNNGANPNLNNADPELNPMIIAANNDSPKQMQMLYDKGAKTDIVNYHGYPLLSMALGAQKLQAAEWALQKGHNPNEAAGGYTALQYSVFLGYENSVKLLLKYRANPDLTTKELNTTPAQLAKHKQYDKLYSMLSRASIRKNLKSNGGQKMIEAIADGNIDIMRTYLVLGANPDQLMPDKTTYAIHQAASHNQVEMMEMLHAKGADIYRTAKQGGTALHWAFYGQHKESAQWLVEHGLDINAQDKSGDTVMHFAVFNQHPKLVQLTLDLNADITIPQAQGNTPLHLAVIKNNADIALKLLEQNNTPLLARNNEGTTALELLTPGQTDEKMHDLLQGHYLKRLIEDGDPVALRAMVKKGLDVHHEIPAEQVTALTYAVKLGATDAVEELLNAGANASTAHHHNFTPLHWASLQGDSTSVRLLLAHGANPNVQSTNHQDTPLMFAADKGHEQCIKLLLQYGALPNEQNIAQDTALILAAKKGSTASIEHLLKAGANSEQTNASGKTSQHIAANAGHKEAELTLASAAGKPSILSPQQKKTLPSYCYDILTALSIAALTALVITGYKYIKNQGTEKTRHANFLGRLRKAPPVESRETFKSTETISRTTPDPTSASSNPIFTATSQVTEDKDTYNLFKDDRFPIAYSKDEKEHGYFYIRNNKQNNQEVMWIINPNDVDHYLGKVKRSVKTKLKAAAVSHTSQLKVDTKDLELLAGKLNGSHSKLGGYSGTLIEQAVEGFLDCLPIITEKESHAPAINRLSKKRQKLFQNTQTEEQKIKPEDTPSLPPEKKTFTPSPFTDLHAVLEKMDQAKKTLESSPIADLKLFEQRDNSVLYTALDSLVQLSNTLDHHQDLTIAPRAALYNIRNMVVHASHKLGEGTENKGQLIACMAKLCDKDNKASLASKLEHHALGKQVQPLHLDSDKFYQAILPQRDKKHTLYDDNNEEEIGAKKAELGCVLRHLKTQYTKGSDNFDVEPTRYAFILLRELTTKSQLPYHAMDEDTKQQVEFFHATYPQRDELQAIAHGSAEMNKGILFGMLSVLHNSELRAQPLSYADRIIAEKTSCPNICKN